MPMDEKQTDQPATARRNRVIRAVAGEGTFHDSVSVRLVLADFEERRGYEKRKSLDVSKMVREAGEQIRHRIGDEELDKRMTEVIRTTYSLEGGELRATYELYRSSSWL